MCRCVNWARRRKAGTSNCSSLSPFNVLRYPLISASLTLLPLNEVVSNPVAIKVILISLSIRLSRTTPKMIFASGSTACLMISAASFTSNSDRLSPPVTLNNTPFAPDTDTSSKGLANALLQHRRRGSDRYLYQWTSMQVRHLS